jgi:tRNA pseudouridine38-40 synthase
LRRLALVLEYDGSRYKGFQWQTGVPSIQGEVERAIKALTGETTRVGGASRTDAGAHSRGQVVDFLTQAPYAVETFTKALNRYLPRDIRVRGACDVPPDFNSRRDATGRVYRYTLLNSKWPSALLRDFSHWVAAPLDVSRMKEAAGHLPGIRDLAAFTVPLPPEKSAVRRIERWDVWCEGELVLIEAEANSFLPHQVRRTNGILVEIGLGRLPSGVIKAIMDGTIKGLNHSPSLPAKGLCLMSVNYPKSHFRFRNEEGYETE